MKDDFRNHDWEKRLRPFPEVWERVAGERGRPFPPPGPPMFGPPPPRPPIMPGHNCCSKAVRFNPHRRGGR